MGIEYWTAGNAGSEALEAEARRIGAGPWEAERPLGLRPDSYVFSTQGIADEVLRKAREVMRIVSVISGDGEWAAEAQWPRRLPVWFVNACRPEDAAVGDDGPALHEMTAEERRAAYLADTWTLAEWLSAMEPGAREWLWWSTEARDGHTIHVVVDRLGDPSNLGSPPGLWWLFRACGAVDYRELHNATDVHS
jgi:hypothetical protein